MANVTQLLAAIEQGQPQAAEALLPLVYDELRRLARAKFVQEKPGQTLQATALVMRRICGWWAGKGLGTRGWGLGEVRPNPLLEPLIPGAAT
jgi:hypothetical protein